MFLYFEEKKFGVGLGVKGLNKENQLKPFLLDEFTTFQEKDHSINLEKGKFVSVQS